MVSKILWSFPKNILRSVSLVNSELWHLCWLDSCWIDSENHEKFLNHWQETISTHLSELTERWLCKIWEAFVRHSSTLLVKITTTPSSISKSSAQWRRRRRWCVSSLKTDTKIQEDCGELVSWRHHSPSVFLSLPSLWVILYTDITMQSHTQLWICLYYRCWCSVGLWWKSRGIHTISKISIFVLHFIIAKDTNSQRFLYFKRSLFWGNHIRQIHLSKPKMLRIFVYTLIECVAFFEH